MKRIKLCLLFLITSAAFFGCDGIEIDMSPLNVVFAIESENPIVETFYTANGETLDFSLTLNRELSTPDVSIERIDVFLNDIKIAEAAETDRVEVRYKLENKTIGKNPLRAAITATAPNRPKTIVNLNMDINVFENKPVYGFTLVADESYRNGAVASLSVKEKDEATLHFLINSVKYLIDDIEIGNGSRSKPDILFTVPNLSHGNHIIAAVIDCTASDDGLNTKITVSKQITIQ